MTSKKKKARRMLGRKWEEKPGFGPGGGDTSDVLNPAEGGSSGSGGSGSASEDEEELAKVQEENKQTEQQIKECQEALEAECRDAGAMNNKGPLGGGNDFYLEGNFTGQQQDDPIVDIGSNNNQSAYAITASGRVWTWGYNGNVGDMGIGAYPNGAYPTPQLILTGEPVRIVTANDGFSYIAIGQSGNIYSWGSNTYGVLLDGYTMMGSARYSVQDVTDYVNALLAPGETVADIYTGGTGTYVLTSAGRLFFAGDGSNCAAAFDNGGAAIATPMDITANIPLVNGEKITQIIPGLRRAIALTDQGNAYSWGQNNYLQTGIPPVSAQVCTPGNLNSALGLPADEYIVSGSSTANSSTTVLTNKGNLYFFGLTSFLLDGNAGGSVMEGLIATGVADANYIDMSASPTPQGMLFVLKDDGTVWVAGNSPYGMGDGTTNAQTSLNDITSYLGLATGETVVKIATSRNGIGIFLTSDGRVLTFGKGNMGILGTGNLNNQFSPVDITPNLQSQTACPLTGVYIGDKAAQYELINDHLLHVIVPPGDSYGYVDLRVVGCESVTVPQGYEYVHSICAR